MPSHLRQLALQFAAAVAVLSLCWPYFALRNQPLPWPETALAIGGTALLFAGMTRQRWWWKLIHASFAPAAWAAARLPLDPAWFLGAFLALLLVYRGALCGRIPLYFTNRATAAALGRLITSRAARRFIDLGAGTGSVLGPLARDFPDAQFTGIENSPAPWLAGYLRTARLKNCTWRWGDIWQTDLAGYDVVYAFLSPAPMSALWVKAAQEMAPDSIFISNSFPVEGVDACEVVEVGDARQTRLYCYRPVPSLKA